MPFSAAMITTLSLALLLFLCVIILSVSYRKQYTLLEKEYHKLEITWQQLDEQHQTLQKEHQASQLQLAEIKTKQQLSSEHHKAQLETIQQAKETLQLEFKDLADRLFENKFRTFKESNHDQLSAMLNPFRSQLKEFEYMVQNVYEKEAKQRVGLSHELQQLKLLNQTMSQEAKHLTQALTGANKTQGIWGEMILEKVLELSGLQNGREFITQTHRVGKAGLTQFPDVIIRLPNQREVVVDAKVSLKHYEQLMRCESSEERTGLLRAHCDSIQNHVKLLSGKSYQQIEEIHSLDFVLLFLPIEHALSVVMQHKQQIIDDALNQNIIIVTPTTLLACLRTIENLWRGEDRNRNALLIAEKAGDMHDKFVGFANDMLDIGKRLETTQKSYNLAMNKLQSGKGNLVQRAQQLKKMGAKTTKHLPPTLQDAESSDNIEENHSETI